MALGITWIYHWNQGSNEDFMNQESQFLHFRYSVFSIYYKLHDTQSQESIQEP